MMAVVAADNVTLNPAMETMVVPAGMFAPEDTAMPETRSVVEARLSTVEPEDTAPDAVVLMALEMRQLAGNVVVPDMALKFSRTGLASFMLIWALAPEGQTAKSTSSTASTRMLIGFIVFFVNLVCGQWVLPHTKIEKLWEAGSDQYWV